jgi:periplasmic mercuric ion binding protein
MKIVKKALLAATISLLAVSCKNQEVKVSQEIASEPVENIKPIPSNPKTASFEIEGMTCAVGCANLIEGKLSKLDGVVEAKVNFESKTATVTYDADVLDQQKITKTVEAVGGGKLYKVSKVKS